MTPAIIHALKGATPLDLLTLILIGLIGGWMGWWQIKWRKSKNPRTERHHIVCQSVEDLVNQKRQIKFRLIVSDQMRVVEGMLEALKREMRDTFFKELESWGATPADITRSIDWRYYQTITDMLGCRLHADLRTMIKENGLPEKTDDQLNMYIDDKFETLKETMRVVFDVYYGDDLRMDRTDLHQIHKKFEDVTKRRFDRMVRECKRIAVDYYREISTIEEKIEELRNTPCQ